MSGHTDVITHLLTIGDILISIGKDHTMRIWNYKEGEEIHVINLHPQFNVTAILHPLTYLNKILIGSDNGRLQLWNINTCKLIYEFKPFDNNCIIFIIYLFYIIIRYSFIMPITSFRYSHSGITRWKYYLYKFKN